MFIRTAALVLLSLAFVPADAPPTFSAPTQITNPWAPFVPGSVKLFRGRDEGARTARVETCLLETRVFLWGGGSVECRGLWEQEFEDGALVEVSATWLAQDDAGNVQVFGELSWEVVDGVVGEAEADNWLVGGATQVGDPPGTMNVADPHVWMSSDPQPGDVFVTPAWPSGHETVTVLAKLSSVKVPAAKYTEALLVQELDDGEDGQPPEKRWIVPGVGIVRERTKHMHSELFATSLLQVTTGY